MGPNWNPENHLDKTSIVEFQPLYNFPGCTLNWIQKSIDFRIVMLYISFKSPLLFMCFYFFPDLFTLHPSAVFLRPCFFLRLGLPLWKLEAFWWNWCPSCNAYNNNFVVFDQADKRNWGHGPWRFFIGTKLAAPFRGPIFLSHSQIVPRDPGSVKVDH